MVFAEELGELVACVDYSGAGNAQAVIGLQEEADFVHGDSEHAQASNPEREREVEAGVGQRVGHCRFYWLAAALAVALGYFVLVVFDFAGNQARYHALAHSFDLDGLAAVGAVCDGREFFLLVDFVW